VTYRLIRGESGTGKEAYAHATTQLSDRAEFHLLKVQLPPRSQKICWGKKWIIRLWRRRVYGCKKKRQAGKFQLANGGTLFSRRDRRLTFVDATKRFRVYKDREVESVGGIGSNPVELIRLITANTSPLETYRKRRFQRRPFYRINVCDWPSTTARTPRRIAKLAEFFYKTV